jgi:DNA-binding MarR family transcriptional regulator
MLRVSSRAAEREVGVSAAQLFVLEKLADAKQPLSVGELAERTLTHQSSVSVVVQKLERAELVSRGKSSDDGRRVELSLTPKARTLLRRAPKAAQHQIIEAINALAPPKRRQLASLLGAVAMAVAPDEHPAMLFEDPSEPLASRKPARARTRS